jgi:hypothetical protein
MTESAMGRLDLSGPGFRLSFFGPEGHEHKLNVTVATEEIEEGQQANGIAIDWFVAFIGLPAWQPQPCRTVRALEQAIEQLMVLLPKWLAVLAEADATFWRELRSFVRSKTARTF